MSRPTFSLKERVNRLFDSTHGLGAPEESDESVADVVGAALGRPITAGSIAALRAGSAAQGLDVDLLSAVATHFDAPRMYLWSQWDFESEQFDGELTLLLQMRDLGVVRLAMRDGSDATAEDLSNILTQLPEQEASAPRSPREP